MRTAAVLGVLAALAAAGSGVGTSTAAFTAHGASSGTMSTAADWVAPAVTLTSPADGIAQRSSLVSLAGAAGTASGDATTVTVSLYAGTQASGSPVLTRSATRVAGLWSTSATLPADGVYTAQATQADAAGNTGASAPRTFTVDTTPPARAEIGAFDGATAAGRLEAKDSIVYAYSEPIAPGSILAGWDGRATAVKARFFNGPQDSFTVLDATGAATIALDAGTATAGGVTTGAGADYVTGTVTFDATLTQSADGRSFTVVLGAPDRANRLRTTVSPPANMTWTPKAGPADLAGNALGSTTPFTETDNDRDF